MPEPIDYIRLSGDEDGGVSLHCYHDACDPYHHGEIAYCGNNAIAGKPYFAYDRVGEFLDFIRQHAESHRSN